MPSIKTREIEIEIFSDDPTLLADLYRTVMRERAGATGSARVSTIVSYSDTQATPEVSEYETILATQGPASAPPVPAPVESDPGLRDRQREAAARAREALAAQRRLKAEEAAAKDAADSITKAAQMSGEDDEAKSASRPRGRPRKAASPAPTPTDDLTGDDEDGDLERTPDTEPVDYAPGAGETANTPEWQRDQCLAALRAVAETAVPGVLDAIKQHVRSFGTAKILEVPLDRMEEFWNATASLCAAYSVPFPATPVTH